MMAEILKKNDEYETTYAEEQKVLINAFKPKQTKGNFKEFITQSPSKFWKFIHYPIKNINWVSLVAIIITIASLSTTISLWKYSNNLGSDISGDKFNTINRISDLKKSYDKFIQSSPEEKLMRWIWMFKDWSYVLNGDPKLKQADCVGSVFLYCRGWGSNMELENIPTFTKRIQNIAERDELKIRKSINEVVSGDIITLDLGGGNQHIAMVYDTCNGLVRYYDMNVYTKKWGFEKVAWGDPSLSMVAQHSFSIWLGNLMQDLNKK